MEEQKKDNDDDDGHPGTAAMSAKRRIQRINSHDSVDFVVGWTDERTSLERNQYQWMNGRLWVFLLPLVFACK